MKARFGSIMVDKKSLEIPADLIYYNLIKAILELGEDSQDRTGVGTKSLFGIGARYSLIGPHGKPQVPILQSKKVNFSAIVKELLWFIKGSTNINDLGSSIWDEWADEDGNLGPIYGKQWRNWDGVDQLKDLIHGLKTNPNSRRHILSAWNVPEIPSMALPPCHVMSQYYVRDGKLSSCLYQRSADMALGVPFNIVSYSLLTILLAKECGLTPHLFTHFMGDAHIYNNHQENLLKQIDRYILNPDHYVVIDPQKDIFSLTHEDIELIDYKSHGPLKFVVAV